MVILLSHLIFPIALKVFPYDVIMLILSIFSGIAMRSKNNFSSDSVNFAPFTLFPSTYPKNEFEKAVEIQPVLNELMHKVAHDYEFLHNSLKK